MRRKKDSDITLDKAEEKINYKGLAAIIISFLFITVAGYLYVSVESSKIVYGKVVMLNDLTSDTGAIQKLIVELEDGRNIQVRLPNTSPFKKNKKVKLLETKTKLLGAKKYKFLGYDE